MEGQVHFLIVEIVWELLQELCAPGFHYLPQLSCTLRGE